MSNRQRSHEEGKEDAQTAPDAPAPLAGQGGPSRVPRRSVRKVRFRDRNGNDCGTVELIDGKIVMSEEAAAFCASVNIFHAGGRLVTPADGKHYLHGLLASLRGTAFWAEAVE